jgi:hypothetical protein
VAQASPKSRSTDGIRIVTFHRWKRFTALIEQGRLNEYVWRGQNADWELLPRAARPGRWRAYSALREPRGRVAADSKEQWLALGQHHGLDTELLDWTSSPYVAAFFAYENERPKPPKTPRGPVVYGLHKAYAIIGETLLKGAPPGLSDDRVDLLRPFDEDNTRLIHQGALFTRLTHGGNMETFVRRKFAGVGRPAILLKVFLPESDREEALKSLNRMRINHLTLFPDLHGAAQYCNLARQCDGYLPAGESPWPLPDSNKGGASAPPRRSRGRKEPARLSWHVGAYAVEKLGAALHSMSLGTQTPLERIQQAYLYNITLVRLDPGRNDLPQELHQRWKHMVDLGKAKGVFPGGQRKEPPSDVDIDEVIGELFALYGDLRAYRAKHDIEPWNSRDLEPSE